MATEHDVALADELRNDGGGAASRRSSRLLAGGVDGNGRLTALTGAVLLVLLAVIGVTILRLHQLISVHLFVGLLLIGPVIVKLASTGYRFVRYYTFNPVYRRKGPPPLALRGLAPFVVLSTLTVLASGVALLVVGPSSTGSLRLIHKASFIVWAAVTGLHVIGHIPEMSELLTRRPRASRVELAGAGDGQLGRAIALAGGLVGGLVLALLLLGDFSAWVSAESVHQFGP
ncbi:MAG TPA: hypothetical protein VHM72_10555 [Solirubrobacteraceae bacterium]|jgi:hypothetical protein|nr:hypothetical protein [Solirubrobacteraceae bacterium]